MNWGVRLLLLSLVLTSLIVGNAFRVKKQFYPSIVYITKSNMLMGLIYVQGLVVVFTLGKLLGRIFFVELRPVEVERLSERAWYALTETCLAFTVFREDLNPTFVFMFTLLLFVKGFHWLADERVEVMERSPNIPVDFHVRIVSLVLVLVGVDAILLKYAYQSLVFKGPSVQLVFGFEYAVLLTLALYTATKYILYLDTQLELNWDNKTVILLYVELVINAIKLSLHLAFTLLMIRSYTLPMFALRPIYFTARALKKTVMDVILYSRALKNLNTLYPSVTEAELAGNEVCIICREELNMSSKKLPCGHIFHTACLRSWFQRQQTCPTCRYDVLVPPPPPPPPRPPPPTPEPAPTQRPSLAHLSDEELKKLELDTREGVEARIKYLRDLELVLDSATQMLETYLSVEASRTQQETSTASPPPQPSTTPSADHIRRKRLASLTKK